MNRSLIVLAAAIALWATGARADDKAQCFDGASEGQTLRDQHKLIEARAQFTICARQVCPKQVRKDCTEWLEQVDRALPTIVVSAKDATGRDLLDVTVTLDGRSFATKLAGESVPVNPGTHALHFETSDGGRLDQQVLVREGVKNESVAVVIAPPPPPAPVGPASDARGGGLGAVEAPSSTPGPWRTIGFVAGGAGIVALGVGAAFGFKAIGDKNAAQCDASNACDPGPLSSARSDSTISTVGFVAGGVLLAGGAALVLLAPSGRPTDASSVRVAPAVGARDAGLLLSGSF
jgi:hypothetical protein